MSIFSKNIEKINFFYLMAGLAIGSIIGIARCFHIASKLDFIVLTALLIFSVLYCFFYFLGKLRENKVRKEEFL